MKIVDNYEAKIWLGLQKKYDGVYFEIAEVSEVIRNWCSEKGQCVTITPTNFVYVHGEEPGLQIGFINYPRYPLSQIEIRNRAIELGSLLMNKFDQHRVSITLHPAVPAGTIMLENENLE
jgi:hypothetical protein